MEQLDILLQNKDPTFHFLQKINSKWITHINLGVDAIKLPEESNRNIIQGIGNTIKKRLPKLRPFKQN